MPAETLEKKISIDSFFQNLDEISDELNRVNEKTDQTSNQVKSVEVKAFANQNYLQSLLQTLMTQEDIIQNVSSDNQQQNTIINNLTNVIRQDGDRVEQIIVNQNQTTNQIGEVGDKIKILEKSREQVVDQIATVKEENSSDNQQLSKAFGVLKQVYDSLSSGVQSVRAEVGDKIKILEKSGEQIIVNQNQTTNQIGEVGDKIKILEKSREQVVDQIATIKKENSSDNQQQNTIINNLTNVIRQDGDRVEQIIVNQNQTTNQIAEVGDKIKILEKSGEQIIVNQNQTINQIGEVGDKIKILEKSGEQIIVNQNQTTNQIGEVGDKIKILEKSGEQVVDQIATIKKENSSETQQLSKAFGVLKQVYDSLSSGVQSVRADVETISEYLLKDQKQRQELLEERKLRRSREDDIKEKSDIITSLKEAFGGGTEQEKFGNIMSQQDYANLMNSGGGADSGQQGGGGLGSAVLGAGGLALGTMGTDAINNIFGTPSGEGGGGTPGSGGTASAGQWKPLLDVIASGEGGYESVNPGQTVPGLTEMTIAQAWATAQRVGKSKGGSGAMGRYQLLSDPIGRARAAGLDPNKDKFSPANQDKIAVYIIQNVRKGKQWLAGTLKGGDAAFAQGIANEWAGVPNLSGQYSYPGQGGKVKASSVKAALEQVKKSPTTTSTTTAKSRTPQASTGTPRAASAAGQQGTPQASTGSNPPGALAPGQRPDRALTSEQFKTAQQAREEGKSQGLTGQALERSVANAVMGTSGATSATGAAIGEPTREIKVSSADLPSPKDMEIASAQPEMKPMDTSSIVPFDTQQVASGGYSQAPRNQGPQSNISSSPDSPEAMPTSNPLTRMWTLSAINHLNINGSMDHIYG